MASTRFLSPSPNNMKTLIIPEQTDLDIGGYGPACEGFIDTIKGIFVKNPQKERAQALGKEKYVKIGFISKELENDLRLTYDNPKWIEKNLQGEGGVIKIKALEHANANGKALTNPGDIVKVAQGMLAFLRTVVQREKPYAERRLKLIKEIEKETDPAKVDAFWEAHEKELKVTAVDRMRTYVKKPVPGFGHAGEEKDAWPFNFKDTRRDYFDTHGSFVTDGSIEAPTPANAQAYAKAIRELMDIVVELRELEKQVYIPYWDSGLSVEYDDLTHGDDLYSYLFSSQSSWDEEAQGLVAGAEYEIGVIICGLYIAMFDKHMVTRQPATEGWVDRVKNVFGGKPKHQVMRYHGTRALSKIKDFVENPDKYRLTGTSFGINESLLLSMDGKPPILTALPEVYTKTVTEASKLCVTLRKDAEAHARLCEPLIRQFEKTMIDNMDKDGNAEQEVLDKAMLPLIAAIPKARRSYYYEFAKKANDLCKNWLGGNPFHFTPVKRPDGETGMRNDYVKEQPVAVPALKDINLVKKIAEAVLALSDLDHPGFKDGLFDDMEDFWMDYEFDRPVRHLWEMMNEEQMEAINAIYSYEDNSQSMHGTVTWRLGKVYISMLKYLDFSLVAK